MVPKRKPVWAELIRLAVSCCSCVSEAPQNFGCVANISFFLFLENFMHSLENKLKWFFSAFILVCKAIFFLCFKESCYKYMNTSQQKRHNSLWCFFKKLFFVLQKLIQMPPPLPP